MLIEGVCVTVCLCALAPLRVVVGSVFMSRFAVGAPTFCWHLDGLEVELAEVNFLSDLLLFVHTRLLCVVWVVKMQKG